MPEILRGNLAHLPLLDVLKLLSSGARTGQLELLDGIGTGEIYLEAGNLVHAVAGAQVGEEAAYTLMGWLQGDFRFMPDVMAPEHSVTIATEQLFLEGASRVEEWAVVKKVIPSADVVLRLSDSGSSGSVSLEPDEWRVLMNVNGVRSVTEIADILGWDDFKVAKVLYRLITADLLEIEETPEAPPKPIVGTDFFQQLIKDFTDVMGLLAPTIVDDEVAALGETRETFPRDKVGELVERVSAEISNEKARLRFQGVMLDRLKSL